MAESQSKVQVVMGQTRGAGATTFVRALAEAEAQANQRTLMLDLDLWTVELSASYHRSHDNQLIQLAEQSWQAGVLPSDVIADAIVPCEQNLWLLPNSLHWLASSYLGGTAGYDFLRALFPPLRGMFDTILVDLGSSSGDSNAKPRPFLPACAAHLAAIESAARIFYVFASPLEYERWRAAGPRVENPEKICLLVNRAGKQKRGSLSLATQSIPLLFIPQAQELHLDPIWFP